MIQEKQKPNPAMVGQNAKGKAKIEEFGHFGFYVENNFQILPPLQKGDEGGFLPPTRDSRVPKPS
jgi:hypothetical protein